VVGRLSSFTLSEIFLKVNSFIVSRYYLSLFLTNPITAIRTITNNPIPPATIAQGTQLVDCD